MIENKITNVIVNLKYTDNADEILDKMDIKQNKIHSFIAYSVKYGWEIHFNVSQNNKYNTIKLSDATERIFNDFKKTDKKVPCFMQPDLKVLIKQYKPLIIKLAKEQKQLWQYLEMEDLIQMCNLVICHLYYAEYYVHKNLIRRAFINYVLLHIRKNKNRPQIVSLEQEYNKSDNDDVVTIKDMVPDMTLLNEQDDKDNEEVERRILSEMKDIIVDIIGIRQYDQLLREYRNKQTTDWSRKLMQRTKAKLFDLGITSKSFNKYYN